MKSLKTAPIDDATEPENTEQVFTELAALSSVEYDRRRKQAAKEIGIRPSTVNASVKTHHSPEQ